MIELFATLLLAQATPSGTETAGAGSATPETTKKVEPSGSQHRRKKKKGGGPQGSGIPSATTGGTSHGDGGTGADPGVGTSAGTGNKGRRDGGS